MEYLWNDQRLSIAGERTDVRYVGSFSYYFFYFQTFAYPSEFLNEKRDFPLKISPEIIVCHVEAVRQPTGAFPPTEVNNETK